MAFASRRELALAIAALLATLALLEGAARLLLDRPGYYGGFASVEIDPQLGHRGIPGYRREMSSASGAYVFALNADGFRGRELPRVAAEPGVRRVAFVGDSFLVGRTLPEDELMTARLEAELATRRIQAESYNLSSIDYGTGQELLLLERFLPRIQPDFVVLALYPGNDVANNAIELAGLTRVSPGDLIRPYVTPERDELRVRFVAPGRAWARAHSRLFAVLEHRLVSTQPSWGIQRPPMSVAKRLRVGNAPREHLELFRSHDPAHRWEQAWRTTESLLRAFHARCEAAGARLLVLVIPTAEQVERTARAIDLDIDARRHTGGSLDELLDWNLPERRLAAFFREQGIEARLLLGPLRAAAQSASDVYTADAHLGASGHRIAAESVAQWIAGAPPPRDEIDGAPTHRLPESASASPSLDFRVGPHRDHLGAGWIVWRAPRESEPWGWWTAPQAEIVLPASDGDLVLRGWLPPEARLPAEIRIRGVGTQVVRVEAAGDFEVRVPASSRTLPTSSEGYVSVKWDAGETHRQRGVRIGLIVHEVGFEGSPSSPR